MAAKLCAPPYNCNVLTYPSVFTESTGRDHWEVLMRARAIDTQSFVIAANQIGRYENGRSSWGQSMVICLQRFNSEHAVDHRSMG